MVVLLDIFSYRKQIWCQTMSCHRISTIPGNYYLLTATGAIHKQETVLQVIQLRLKKEARQSISSPHSLRTFWPDCDIFRKCFCIHFWLTRTKMIQSNVDESNTISDFSTMNSEFSLGEWEKCGEQVEIALVKSRILDEESREHYHKTALFIYNHSVVFKMRNVLNFFINKRYIRYIQ